MIKTIEELKRDLAFARFNRKVIEDRHTYHEKGVEEAAKELHAAREHEDQVERELIVAQGESS